MIELPLIKGPITKVGLTGSMGTGKSTAAAFFKKLGTPVVDADELARKVVEPGRSAFNEIVRAFGADLVNAEGGLDRALLAARVFNDEKGLRLLEKIIHPRVHFEAEAEMAALLPGSRHGFVVYDVPLLFEKAMEGMFDLIVTVYADRPLQTERVKARSNLTESEIDRRLSAQIDIAEKARRSHVVLDNRGATEELSRQVGELTEAIARHNAEKRLTRDHKG